MTQIVQFWVSVVGHAIEYSRVCATVWFLAQRVYPKARRIRTPLFRPS